MENIQKVLFGFYNAKEMSAAKKVLVSCFLTSLANCSFKAKQCKSATQDVHEAEVDDIMGLHQFLDLNSTLSSITFVTSNFDHILKYRPEEISANVEGLASRVEEAVSSNSITKQFDESVKATVNNAVSSITEKISSLSVLCSRLSDSISNHNAGCHTITGLSQCRSQTY